ncbi:MAG: hypothetical protein MMC33_003104 [Icmadophila ericetorum]|nr:hypothetical protein [Icmadophila ericetorum]
MSLTAVWDRTAMWAAQREKDSKQYDEAMALEEAKFRRRFQETCQTDMVPALGNIQHEDVYSTIPPDATPASTLIPGYNLYLRDYQGSIIHPPAPPLSSPTTRPSPIPAAQLSSPFVGPMSSPSFVPLHRDTIDNLMWPSYHPGRAELEIQNSRRLLHEDDKAVLATNILMRLHHADRVGRSSLEEKMDSVANTSMPIKHANTRGYPSYDDKEQLERCANDMASVHNSIRYPYVAEADNRDEDETEDEPIQEEECNHTQPKNTKRKRAVVTPIRRPNNTEEFGGSGRSKKKARLILSQASKPKATPKPKNVSQKSTAKPKARKAAAKVDVALKAKAAPKVKFGSRAKALSPLTITPAPKPRAESGNSSNTFNSDPSVVNLTPAKAQILVLDDPFITYDPIPTVNATGKGKRELSVASKKTTPIEKENRRGSAPATIPSFLKPDVPPPKKRQRKPTPASTVSNQTTISAIAGIEKEEKEVVNQVRFSSSGRVINKPTRYGG